MWIVSKSDRAVIRKSNERGHGRGALLRHTDLTGPAGEELRRLIDESVDDTGLVKVGECWYMWHLTDDGASIAPAGDAA